LTGYSDSAEKRENVIKSKTWSGEGEGKMKTIFFKKRMDKPQHELPGAGGGEGCVVLNLGEIVKR